MGTNNSIKATKKLKGFMCHCPASTAVCMSQEYRSAILPHATMALKHQAGGVNSTAARYFRLGAIERTASPAEKDRRMVSLPQEAATGPGLISAGNVFQVVVMRVSIHCQGCAGKLKKHLSKMEGVTSFSIDLESKRVTVMGHVSPSGVLESVSKVKKAEFWPC